MTYIAANHIRRQLTLFVEKADRTYIEEVRRAFNPQQSELINSHVTLCKEDEIEDLSRVLNNLTQLKQKMISINFGEVIRFDNGKGVLMPATKDNEAFNELRQKVLNGSVGNPRQYEPHLTLMHPRNSICTQEIFEQIQKVPLPTQLCFKTISLIEQFNGGQWKILKTFELFE